MKRQSLPFCCLTTICIFLVAAGIARAEANDLASFVNPFIGMDNSGNTYPGAVAPFGSVQMTPNFAGNGYCYYNTHIHGFVVDHSNWYETSFDAELESGRGARNQVARARTRWNSSEIWMRCTFTFHLAKGQPAIFMWHEQGADVYINGVLAVTSPGPSASYSVFPVMSKALRPNAGVEQ